MSSNYDQRTHSLAIASGVYFGSALIIGLPVMYFVYWVFVGILNLLSLNWLVVSPAGIVTVAAAFLVGIWVAGNLASRLFQMVA